jgi:hypothetical protein
MPEVRGKKEMTGGRFFCYPLCHLQNRGWRPDIGGQKFVVVVRLIVNGGKKKIRRTVPLIYWR